MSSGISVASSARDAMTELCEAVAFDESCVAVASADVLAVAGKSVAAFFSVA